MTIEMTIHGRLATAARTVPVVNPATGEAFGRAPAADPGQVRSAVDAARAAFTEWSGTSLEARRAALIACGERLAAHAAEVAALLTLEQGKPTAAAHAEVLLSASWFASTAALELPLEELRADGLRVTTTRVPHGVVAAITPFNFPIILAICKIAPALLAGNTVVVKPAPATPLSTLRMVQLFNEVLPPGVLNAISGEPELGPLLIAETGVDLISFTGSVPVGRAIARSAGLRRVVLELGGNDPAIVLPGADLAAVAADLFALSMINSGQFCAAVKRIYVPRADRATFVDHLVALAEQARMGDGRDPGTQFGPLTQRAQVDRADELVRRATEGGARVLTGGKPDAGPGHFYPATVVTDLPPGTELEMTEQFAPVIPVLGYDDPADAVVRANATEYGLGASIWGDPERAEALADDLEAGTVWLNSHGVLRHDVPFGGIRSSGLGVEYGYWGLLEYTRVKVLNRAGV